MSSAWRSEVEAELGPVDILVNNAGINIRGPIQQLTEADWDAVIDTNLKGPFLCARAFGPRMVARGWGRVINLGSVLGVIALPGRAPVRVVEGRHHQPDARACARMGGNGRDGERDLPWRVRDRDEPVSCSTIRSSTRNSWRRSRWAAGVSSTS